MGLGQSLGCQLHRCCIHVTLIFLWSGLLTACSTEAPSTSYRRVVWEIPVKKEPRRILWEKCPPQQCPFLEEYGPNTFHQFNRTKQANERCYGSECRKLKEFGPRPEHFYNEKLGVEE